MVALDEHTYKIWKKLPDQSKSATVRAMLTDLKENGTKPEDPKESLVNSFSANYPSSNGSEKHSKTAESNLSEMAHIINKHKKCSSTKPEDSIEKRLYGASH